MDVPPFLTLCRDPRAPQVILRIRAAFIVVCGALAVLPIKEVPHIVEFTDDLTVTLEGLTGAFLFACITTFRMSSIVETPTGMELLLHFALLSAIIPFPPFFICVP